MDKILYPEVLDTKIQFLLGSFAVLFNIAVYSSVWYRSFRGRSLKTRDS